MGVPLPFRGIVTTNGVELGDIWPNIAPRKEIQIEEGVEGGIQGVETKTLGGVSIGPSTDHPLINSPKDKPLRLPVKPPHLCFRPLRPNFRDPNPPMTLFGIDLCLSIFTTHDYKVLCPKMTLNFVQKFFQI